ncbi:GEVED domain-containing protein [Adhaeribacter radiodurans]|uniref:S8 family serine peptidase n=1 Tax=Adhaeribacter radiodurans TaxID=2745197 RepID=A0A7L7L6E0_9BACT|nr:GEVED domain-containing protein [Adhaeribacter radiodurans]QMU28343.1 S8 family serine peptidase [Adhaeribacter radiodurans]
MKIKIFTFYWCLVLFNLTTLAQTKTELPAEYAYYRNGKKVLLTPKADEVFVTFASKVNLAKGKTLGIPLQNQITKVNQQDVFAPMNAVRYKVNSSKAGLTGNLSNVTQQFNSNQDVITAYPAFKIGKETVYVGNKLTYTLKKDGNQELVKAFLKSNKATLIEEIDLGDRKLYVVAIYKGGNVFTVANGLFEKSLVEYAEPDFTFTGHSDYLPNDIFYPSQWFLSQDSDADIDAPEAWDITAGSSSVVVAVIDGHGYDLSHPDLAGQIVNPYDATNNGNSPLPQNEYANHGTPCAGLIAGATNNRIGGSSVGNNIKVMPVMMGYNVETNGRWHTTADIIARAASRIINTPGLVAVSNSYTFGSNDFAATVEVSFSAMRYNSRSGLGAVILGSTGNDNKNTPILYPANYDFVVGVGASNVSDKRASFSNYGGYVDIVAPGVNTITTDRSGIAGYVNDDYTFFDGTSAACPVAAGVVGLMASLRPDYGASNYMIALQKSAEKVGGYEYLTLAGHPYGTWNNEMGYGRVNAFRALQFIQGLPLVYSFEPVGGPVGTSVKIKGKNFLGAGSVTFSGVSAQFTIVNESTIIATSPAGAGTGYIQVSNAAGTGTSPNQWLISAYCIPLYETPCTSGDFINNFSLNTLANNNSGCNGQAGNYINYDPVGTNTTCLLKGQSYTISMQGGPNLSQGFGVWLDCNNDGDFNDAGEFIYKSPTPGKGVFTGTVTIPSNATTGLRRLRVRTKYFSVLAANESCSTFNVGETEDYTVAIGYCVPTLNCQQGDYINNFSFNTLVHDDSGCDGTIGGYTNFPATGSLTTTVAKGKRYSLKVQAGSFPQGFGVWIDYNNDQDFEDAGELIYASPTASTEPYNTTITIPTNVSTGQRRLRVMSKYNTLVTNTDACSDFANGEVEDYTITIANTVVASSQWNKRFGGSGTDNFSKVIRTKDGGYLLGGHSPSPVTGDKSQGSRGGNDYWLVKTDAQGNKQWDKRYGGDDDDNLNALIATSDGGYLLGGNSLSIQTGDKSQGSRGSKDYWVVKVNASGVKQWDKRFGGTLDDDLRALIQLPSGEYILAGHTLSGDNGDKSEENWGASDFWVVKISSTGNKIWDKRFGGTGEDWLEAALLNSDGSLLLGGRSTSGSNGNKTQASRGGRDYWVIKINSSGTKQWDKRFGGSLNDDLQTIIRTSDGNYLLGGTSNSFASGDHSQTNQGGTDYWLVKMNSSGNKLWDKRFGGTEVEELQSLIQTTDGGYLLAGRSNSEKSADKSQGTHGGFDYWILKTNNNGTKQWDKRFGGNADDNLRSALQTADGGYLLGGRSNSDLSGDRTQPTQGSTDYWLVKVSPTGGAIAPPAEANSPVELAPEVTSVSEQAVEKKTFRLETYPNPFSDKLTVSFTPQKSEFITVKVYNSQGLEIKTLFQGSAEAGKKLELTWQVSSEKAGMYIVRFVSNSITTSQKVLLRK